MPVLSVWAFELNLNCQSSVHQTEWFICLRYWSIPGPFACCRLPKCSDCLTRPKQIQRTRVCSDPVNSAIEVSDLTVGGENIDVKIIADSNLTWVRHARSEKIKRHTRPTAPATIIPKLKVCWVVRAAFSPVDSWPHGTLPSSLPIVTCFLGAKLSVPASVFVVAYCL